MCCRAQHHPKGGAQRLVEGKNGMCRQSGEERFGSRAVKPMFGNRSCRGKSDQPQMRQQQGMPGKQMDRPQHFGSEFSPALGKRTPPETLHRARTLAMRMGLKYVYEGNIF